MRHQEKQINAATANHYLLQSAGNRTMRYHRIRRYCEDMLNGKWNTTHQGIAFNINGKLIDGHHRMHAIIAADLKRPGFSISMVVTFDVPCGINAGIDQMMPRTTQDAMFLSDGSSYSPSFIATARILMTAPLIRGLEFSSPMMIKAVIDEYGESIKFAEESFNNTSVNGITRGVRCCVARAWLFERDTDRIASFCKALKTGVIENHHTDTAAVVLRNVLQRTGRQTEEDRYAKTQAMLRAYLDRTPMTKAYGISRDLWPIPPLKFNQ